MPAATVTRARRLSPDGILAACARLLARRGYADVSLRQLIAAAGVSSTAFYARFPSKEAVLIALTERFFTELQAEATRSLGAVRSLDAGIDRGLDVLCAELADRKALVRLIVSETGSSPDTVATTRRAYALLVGFLASRFAGLAARGRIAVADPTALAWALVGALELQIVRWAVWDELDLPALRTQLGATARAIVPALDGKEPR